MHVIINTQTGKEIARYSSRILAQHACKLLNIAFPRYVIESNVQTHTDTKE